MCFDGKTGSLNLKNIKGWPCSFSLKGMLIQLKITVFSNLPADKSPVSYSIFLGSRVM